MLASLALTLLALSTQKGKQAAPAAALQVGMPAPALAIESWLKGGPVERFEPGKFYVIEFWATWCPPCIASMPHLSQLAREYADDGLTIVGVSSADDRGNSLEKVKSLVSSKGDAVAYTMGWDKGRQTNDAFMRAAGRNGIPCSFVVDKAGRVAYIGHPLFLDEPLAEIVDGTWDLAQDPARLERDSQSFFALYASARTDPKGTLAKLAEFESAHPKLAALSDPLRLNLTLAGGDAPGATAVGTRMLERGKAAKDVETLLQVAAAFSASQGAVVDHELALNAALAANEITGAKDAAVLAALAGVHAARGDYARAVETQTQALQAAPERKRAELMRTLEEYQAKSAGK